MITVQREMYLQTTKANPSADRGVSFPGLVAGLKWLPLTWATELSRNNFLNINKITFSEWAHSKLTILTDLYPDDFECPVCEP